MPINSFENYPMSWKPDLSNTKPPIYLALVRLYPHIEANRKVKQYAERLLKKPDALKLFSYAESEGTEIQRTAGAAWFRKMGLHTDSQHIILAAGGQNALTATVCGLLKQGDRIGTDYVTYPGIKTIAQMIGVQLVAIQHKDFEMTEAGIYYAIQN